MNSRRHKEHLAGKPVKMKAKITPYNKLQPGTAFAVRIAHTCMLYFVFDFFK